MAYRSTIDQRFSNDDLSKRDVPSFIEPLPPLISNPFMRPRPQKGINLMEQFQEDSELEEQELVQVFLRVKPCAVPSKLYEIKSETELITSGDTATVGHGRKTQHIVSKLYKFSKIFDGESTQKEIFNNVVKENLRKLPDGHNFTLLTYGASGSGKTFTLMGTVAAPGLVPRSLEYVFRVVDGAQEPMYKPGDNGPEKLEYYEQQAELQWVKQQRQVPAPIRDKYRRMSTTLKNDFTVSTLDLSNRTKYYVWVSFVEIYNEAVYDLLVKCDRRSASKLRIREDASGHVFVKGATQVFVRSGEEAYDVLVSGKHNLQVAATGVHQQSSRSHCIFTITMLTKTENSVRTSTVRFCDLAGSERVVRTRNTGARLQESRSINSSLHVLERCLHMLRRGRHAIVPYRESKLTRLLGAGLSGARGEAVSMVVTVNPAPEYQNESKHVLQLASVAREIQVNNTMVESTLEGSCISNTTVATNEEVMRLRADCERVHFELAQCQARCKELISSMKTKQQEVAVTMTALVEEAKDMTRQFYQDQIQAMEERHRSEIEDLIDEYESKLGKCRPSPNFGTPSRSLKDKNTQLMKELAVLEEKVVAEQLARVRAEEEVQHLRACIDERDEKASDIVASDYEVEIQTDSENEDSQDEIEDQCNKSLEPRFKIEKINYSRLNKTGNNETDVKEISNDSVLEKSTDKDDSSNQTIKDSTSDVEEVFQNNENDVKSSLLRGTYCVSDTSELVTNQNSSITRGTYFVKDGNNTTFESEEDNSYIDAKEASHEKKDDNFKIPEKITDTFVSKISKIKSSEPSIDTSLVQFEKFEQASKKIEANVKSPEEFGNIKILKEKRKFFDLTEDPDEVDPSSAIDWKLNEIKTTIDDFRSPSIVKEDVPKDYETATIKKLLGQNNSLTTEVSSSVQKSKLFSKTQDSIDLFEDSPCVTKCKEMITKLPETLIETEETGRSVETTVTNQIVDAKTESKDVSIITEIKAEQPSIITEPNQEEIADNNTVDEFENIYNDLTASRATEFELLVSQSINNTLKDIKPDAKLKIEKETQKKLKYNLRNKLKSESEDNITESSKPNEVKKTVEEVSLKSRPKRNLRLRRPINLDEDTHVDDKLNNIVNLQKEFSDVTLDVPATKKVVVDIPSPEKVKGEEENMPMGTQSCPAKSITRSRRKLFTPRVEPLEESFGQTGDSSERVYVPRPSYHRGRARRKL